MTKNYSVKKALFASVISLVLCLSMLVGTTFAWFTDSETSANNNIIAGNLDVEMYWAKGTEDPASAIWNDASVGAVFNYDKWEPGYVEVRHIKIANEGTLALKYNVSIVANGEVSDLADVIDVYYADPAVQIAGRSELVNATKLGTLTEVLGALGETGNGSLEAGKSDVITIAFKMQESAGNEYKNASIGTDFSIQLIATQLANENDSFGNDYDKNAVADIFPGFQGGSAAATVALDDQGLTTTVVTMGGGDVSATIPAGVKVAEGTNSLGLSVTTKNTSEANILLGESEKMSPLDVHIDGVASNNTTAMLVTLKGYLATGLNAGALRLYHVENGATVAMTYAATPENHNEFSYEPLTGDLTLALASFSEVAVVADANNPWDGKTETPYSGSGTEADPYLIANADQFAYFRTQVDNGNSFEGKFVKLNNNIYLSNKNFDPIGWGYVNKAHNRNGDAGKVFMGTFDGNGKTIFDLYQSGWDLEEESNGTTDYTYTNCGFGLFAAASGATFKNLTISGAYVRVECVEAGVLVGLSQNSCTYDNIKIHNSKVANYQRPAGGLIGEVSGDGTTTITNVTIGSDVVVGSLWGDFDAPCGGVIGARWDDAGKDPKIVMKNVEVGARMDVYSDVTSAYQWYAYRRAGMLIGNTELTATNNKHLAAAPFLTCENVKVYYGDWAAYHYCQFTNQDNSWCNNYPWVRVEEGENCSPYSNPRYGQPVVGGVTVSTDKHTCTGEHLMERRFNQLYGGGQGVYGQFEHEGVEVINYRYSITYVNDYQVLAIRYITESGAVKTAYDVAANLVKEWASANITGSWDFGGWMNAGSTKISEIPADNTKDIVLYPYFNKPYTARFVDQQGNVVAWCLFHAEDLTKLEAAKTTAKEALPNPGELFEFDYWEVNANGSKVQYSENNFKGYTYDVTIYPVYKYTGNLKLTPVDEDSDGTIDYYKVEAVDKLDEKTTIPGYVNGVPVKTVVRLYQNKDSIFGGYFDFASGVNIIIVEEGVKELQANSLAYSSDLEEVHLPHSIDTLGKNTFSRNTVGDKKELTIYYDGSRADWDAISKHEDWANGLKKGSKIVCTDGYYTATKVGTLTDSHTWTWTSTK